MKPVSLGGEQNTPHCRKAFLRLPEDKQVRIRNAATSEFASRGYVSANINVMAKNAGISIGSMYNYFSSKEELFLYLMDYGFSILEGVIAAVNLSEGGVYDKIEKLLYAAMDFSIKYPEMNRIYLDVTSEGLSHLSGKLSLKLESITAKFYRRIIEEGVESGEVDPAVDPRVASFCIDNLIFLFQHSFSSNYFRERMGVFTGVSPVAPGGNDGAIDPSCEDADHVIKGMMWFVKGGLGGRKY